MNLQDKVAIITGSGGGIGRGIALKFGSLGAKVVVADLKIDGAKETVSLLEKAGGKGLALGTDITDRDQVQDMVKTSLSAFGKLDILVNNAGWDIIEPFMRNNPELWDKVIAINLKGPI
ncbi:MAG: SDR family NAD(P)-dependent oxidoreductase, partial [Deltaproteobacteria bacterium]|nr:SDR family NAD(P)-dependent oxidoreductase [Deltaproteobacteria bacterium]